MWNEVGDGGEKGQQVGYIRKEMKGYKNRDERDLTQFRVLFIPLLGQANEEHGPNFSIFSAKPKVSLNQSPAATHSHETAPKHDAKLYRSY